MWIALALSAAAWAVTTGLAVEKYLVDGVQSWTMVFAMPVFIASIAFMLHLFVEDLRGFRLIRAAFGFVVVALTLMVTLPNSIGSSGSAKDAQIAQASAANRGIAVPKELLESAKIDLKLAKEGIARECVGVPEVIKGKEWPNCRYWRRQEAAHTLSVERYGKQYAEAPIEKTALSGDTRIAYLLSGIGSKLPERFRFSVSEADVAMVQPIAPPIAGELICAFFGFLGLEFHKLARREEEEAKKKAAAEAASAGTKVEIAAPVAVTKVEAEPVEQAAIDPEPSILIEEEVSEPTPPKGGKKPTRQQKRKDKVQNWVRDYTLANGHPPAFRVVQGRFHLKNATASRWRTEALKDVA